MLEKEVEKYLTKKVEELGGLSYKWVSPMRAGVPDRIIILNKKVYFVELKRPGGKLRPIQLHEIRKLKDHGQDVYVVDSYEAVNSLLGYWQRQGEADEV